MEITEDDLRQNYSSQSTDQLLTLRGQGTLTEVAARVIDEVLDERGVAPEERERIAVLVSDSLRKEQAKTDWLASPGIRLVAQIIDSVIAFAILFSGAVLVGWDSAAGGLTIAIFFAYLLLADALPKGQSIGKRVVGIYVVDVDTTVPCTYFQSLVRNGLLLVLGILDWLFIFGRKHQRLGDMLAKTIVVRSHKRAEAQQALGGDSRKPARASS